MNDDARFIRCLFAWYKRKKICRGGEEEEDKEDIWVLRGKRRDILDVSCSLPTSYGFDLKKIGRT